MGVERKCSKCATWNKAEDHCTNCGNLINPVIFAQVKHEEREEAIRNLPPTKLDIFIEKWRNHNNFIVKGTFYIFYSIWIVFMAIGGFFTWISATTVG
jgi:hypothetical protein